MSGLDLFAELAKAKAVFQQRAILAAMGVNPDSQCATCGHYHESAALANMGGAAPEQADARAYASEARGSAARAMDETPPATVRP